MGSESSFFYENEMRVLHSLTRVMRWLWLAFPMIYLGNILKLFQIEYSELNDLALISLLILWLPTLAERAGISPKIRRYLCVVGLGVVIAVIATNENIGIYMSYSLALITSLLFFDMVFTIKIAVISYIMIVISLYFRAPGANHGEFETPFIWWVSRSAGFLIEAVAVGAVCTVVAKFSHILLERLDAARKETVVAEKKAMMTGEMQRERDAAEERRMAAERANKEMSDYLAGFSREITTPMNTILSMDEQILKETAEGNTREYAESILVTGRMLLSLTEDLMEVTDAGAKKSIMRHGPKDGVIDRAEGLKYASGKEEFYTKLLQVFKDQAEGRRKVFTQALDEGDVRSYTVAMHSLKSNARMIGAAQFAEMAMELEQDAKMGDLSGISGKHESLMQEYDRVLDEIDGILSGGA